MIRLAANATDILAAYIKRLQISVFRNPSEDTLVLRNDGDTHILIGDPGIGKLLAPGESESVRIDFNAGLGQITRLAQ